MRGLKKLFVILFVVLLLTDVCLSNELKKKKKKKAPKRNYNFHNDGKLITLTDDNFDELTKKGVWMVKFYAPWCGVSKSIAANWKEFARVAGETINVGELDCIANPLTAKLFNVKTYPTVYLFGEHVGRTEYKGEHTIRDWLTFASETVKTKIKMVNGNDSIEKMAKKLMEEAKEDEEMSKNSDVIIVSSDTIDEEIKKGPLFVNFYATWCEHCKELRPIWEKFATYAKVNERPYRVAKVNTAKDHAIATRFHVKGFPTIMYFKEGKEPVSYLGERKLGSIIDYAEFKQQPDPFDEL